MTAILELFGTRQVAVQKWCKRRSFSHLSRNVKHTRAVLTDPGWYRGSMGEVRSTVSRSGRLDWARDEIPGVRVGRGLRLIKCVEARGSALCADN